MRVLPRRAQVGLRRRRRGAAYVSKRVRLLEESLGVKLLFRSTRRVAVTEDGERVYRWAQKILDDVDHMVDEVSATKLDPRGLIRINSSTRLRPN